MFVKQISRFVRCTINVLCLVLVVGGWNQAAAQPQLQVQQEQMLQVNVNTADAETIADILVGVGISRAQAIVDYRTEHGRFNDVDDLIQVKGIGEATLETNKERISLD